MKWHWVIPVIVITLILGFFLPPDVFSLPQGYFEGYNEVNLKSYNVGIEVDKSWNVLGIIDTDYYPGITLYDGWYKNWRNQLRLGLIHNVGQSVNLQNFDEVTQYFKDYQMQWCTNTQENPVYEVTPSEEGWTICLKMGNFTFNDITVDERRAYQVSYQWTDEFRLPGGQLTKDIFSGWTYWANLIPYGDDLIFVSGYAVNENVDEQEETILHSLNSVKILNDGQPIFENTEPPSVTTFEPEELEIITESIKTEIPDWIRNNAKWWSDGAIGDSDFTSGIQFMIKENIILIPDLPEQTTETTEGVPDWVRNNAGWWADGQISDDDFVNGIKYLVEQGIIKV